MAHKKEILARALQFTGIGPLLRNLRPWRGLLTLNYHRIGCVGDTPFDPGVFSATAEQLDQQLRWLKVNADVVSLNDLATALANPRGRSVLLTFDDGYRDNFDLAFPLFQQHRLPATFFITTGFIDQRRVAWWDEISWIVNRARTRNLPSHVSLQADGLHWFPGEESQVIGRVLRLFKSLPTGRALSLLDELAESTGSGRCPSTPQSAPWMSWDMIRQLRDGGHSIGAHTVTHPLLARCSIDRQRAEIVDSKRRLEEQLGITVDSFSYPVGTAGAFTDETSQLMRDAGIRWAFGFQGGYCTPEQRHDALDLPRVAVESGLSTPRFQALNTLPALFA